MLLSLTPFLKGRQSKDPVPLIQNTQWPKITSISFVDLLLTFADQLPPVDILCMLSLNLPDCDLSERIISGDTVVSETHLFLWCFYSLR